MLNNSTQQGQQKVLAVNRSFFNPKVTYVLFVNQKPIRKEWERNVMTP